MFHGLTGRTRLARLRVLPHARILDHVKELGLIVGFEIQDEGFGGAVAQVSPRVLNLAPPEAMACCIAFLSPGLERIVRRCLEKEPSRRSHSARDVGFVAAARYGLQYRCPVKDTVCGLAPPLLLTEISPMPLPLRGDHVTSMLQEFPAATLVPHVFV